MVGIIDSMTPEERRDPGMIQVSRRQRIASGAGVQPKQVSELVKQFEMTKPLLTGMAGKNPTERIREMHQLQQSMLDPSRGIKKVKEGTGKRLTSAEKKQMAKEREKRLRQMKRKNR
jgi:signal recognition particle subunit SRP54